MPSSKRFNNTFTKRVDHDGGLHRATRSIKEPAVCRACQATRIKRRWTKGDGSSLSGKGHPGPAQMTLCPACKQASTGEPRGLVFVGGAFFTAHTDEIENLLRNEVKRAAEDNVLARIMDWKKEDGPKLSITTTTEHLAQRLGHALNKAFDGDVKYDFSHENKIERVSWHRD
jgi:NMD protein affecting ribosome stability and mRNA decay